MSWVRRCAWSAAAGVLALAVSGCGMAGAPLPPSLNLAEPVSDLAAARTGDQVRLTWTMPKKNTDKLLLKDEVDVRVCRRQENAKACVGAGDLHLAPGADGTFSEELPEELATGTPRAVTYFVVLRNRNGRTAGLSNGAAVVAGEAPAAVQGLDATVRKEGVVLHWKAATEGPEPTAVRLERKLLTPVATTSKRARGPMAQPPELVEQNLLVDAKAQGGTAPNGSADGAIDKSIRFGATYEYRAQRLVRVSVDGKAMELDGPLSAAVRVEAADVFPPAVPEGLAAVAVVQENGTAPAIDLNWQPNTETDLAGYVVYRREGGGVWQRISPSQPLVGPGFHDAHVEAGHTYDYAVTAVDQGGHESGRSSLAQEAVPNP